MTEREPRKRVHYVEVGVDKHSYHSRRLKLSQPINIIQREAHKDSKRPLQRLKGLGDTHAEKEKKESNAKKEREIEGLMTGDTIRVPVQLIMQEKEF
jgi:hypothetical protein